MCKLALIKKTMGTALGLIISLIVGVIGTVVTNKLTTARLTGAEQEQNAFNAEQAEIQRQWSSEQNEANNAFNAAEAQRNRDFQAAQVQNQMNFQERMDNTLYQRRVADMQAAGINPALAVGGVSVGSTSGASGAGSSASASPLSGASASGSGRGLPQSMSDVMNSAFMKKSMEQMDSQIQMNDAKTMRDLAEAGLLGEKRIGQSLENSWFVPMKEAELKNLLSDLDSKDVQRALQRQNISESEARESLTLTQNIIAKSDASIRDQLNRASLRLTLNQAFESSKRAHLYGEQALTEGKRRQEIDASINELYQRAIMEGYQAGKFSADELESMERAGILKVEREVAEAGKEKRIQGIQVVQPKLDYWLGVAGKTSSVLNNVGSAYAKFSTGINMPNMQNMSPYGAFTTSYSMMGN